MSDSKTSLWAFGIAVSIGAFGCGGGAASGVAVGRVAEGLPARAQSAPRGGDLCLVQESLASQPGGPEKPMSDACAKAFKQDRVHRRAMIVLGAYGATLADLGRGGDEERAGHLEAAMSPGSASEGEDKAVDDAASQLATLLAAGGKKDLEKLIQDAAPSVATICDALVSSLDKETRGFKDAQADVEKKRLSKTDRRCGSLDNKSVCVSGSTIDAVTYAMTYGELSVLEHDHAMAHGDVAGFCAAHKKLEEAAKNGDVSKDATFDAVVEAVKSSRGGGGSAAPAPESKPAAKGK